MVLHLPQKCICPPLICMSMGAIKTKIMTWFWHTVLCFKQEDWGFPKQGPVQESFLWKFILKQTFNSIKPHGGHCQFFSSEVHSLWRMGETWYMFMLWSNFYLHVPNLLSTADAFFKHWSEWEYITKENQTYFGFTWCVIVGIIVAAVLFGMTWSTGKLGLREVSSIPKTHVGRA